MKNSEICDKRTFLLITQKEVSTNYIKIFVFTHESMVKKVKQQAVKEQCRFAGIMLLKPLKSSVKDDTARLFYGTQPPKV